MTLSEQQTMDRADICSRVQSAIKIGGLPPDVLADIFRRTHPGSQILLTEDGQFLVRFKLKQETKK